MAIYKWADEYNWNADYYDMHTGRTYGVTQYRDDPAMPGIPVYEDGQLIGFAKKKED